MHLDIKGIGVEVTPALNVYIEKQIGGLARYLGAEASAATALVEVGRTTRHHAHDHILFARVNIRLGAKVLRAEAETQDIRASLDEVHEELEKEILKFKGKKLALLRRGGRSIKKLLHLSPLARFRRRKIEE